MIDTVQSMFLIVFGVVAVLILLKVLIIVHRQTGRVNELEQQMKLMETSEQAETLTTNETKGGE